MFSDVVILPCQLQQNPFVLAMFGYREPFLPTLSPFASSMQKSIEFPDQSSLPLQLSPYYSRQMCFRVLSHVHKARAVVQTLLVYCRAYVTPTDTLKSMRMLLMLSQSLHIYRNVVVVHTSRSPFLLPLLFLCAHISRYSCRALWGMLNSTRFFVGSCIVC